MTAKSLIEQVAEERAVEKQDREKRNILLNKKEAWQAQGYIVNRLEGLDKVDLSIMQGAYDKFERDILELSTLRAKIVGLNRITLEPDFSGIEANLANPDKISDIKRDITNLKKKLEKRDDRLRDEARAYEIELKEGERVIAELNAKREQEYRMRIEYEAKIKEEENKRDELIVQQKKEKRLEKELQLQEKHIDLKVKKADTQLKERELKMAKIEFDKTKVETTKLEKEMRSKEQERLRKEKEFEIKLQERIVLELESKKLEEERMNLELQAKIQEEEKQLKELEKQRLKEERLCKELGLIETKEGQKLAKLDEKRDKAQTQKIGRIAKLRAEKRRLKELEMLSQRQELAVKANEAKKAVEDRMKLEAESQLIKERKDELILDIEKKKLERQDLTANLKNIENEVKSVQTSLKKIESEGIAVGVGVVSGGVMKKGTKIKIEIPKSIEGWEGIFEYWDAPESQKLVPEIEKLSDKDIAAIINWINKDETARSGCSKLIQKWNTDNRYFTVYDQSQNLLQVKRTFIGGLYTLCEILSGREVTMYLDNIRYWQPILDLYEKNRPIYDLPAINKVDYEVGGEIVAKYTRA